MFARFARCLSLAGLAALGAAASASAAALDVSLNFASLPSAQGFSYVASGAHAGVAEATVFSVSGGTLTQNTIGQYLGTSGAGLYYQRANGITTTEAKQIRVTARALQAAGSSVFPNGEGGFCFLFAHGSVQYGFMLTPTRIGYLQSSWVLLPATYDNTQFHDYIFDWSPGGSWRIYRDGVQISTGSGGGSLAVNRILIGDGTGGANARGEVSAYRFVQDLATPATPSTWGRIKGLYR